MTDNPFTFTDEQTADTRVNTFTVQVAVVTTVPSYDGNSPFGHTVKLYFRGDDSPARATVMAPTQADVNLPQVGDVVLVANARNVVPVVIGTIYPMDSDIAPAYNGGERVIGHVASESTITLQENGNVEIDAAGDVTVYADGTVRMGNSSGTAEPVARQGDSVEVSDPDSGTLTGQITGGSGDVEST
jgi:hypothetical protein